MLKNPGIYLGILTLVSLFFTNCGKQQEGCNDPLAANFDVGAEENCCCKYPAVILNYRFFNDGKEYNIGNATTNGDTLQDTGGNAFVIKNIRFLFSDFVINNNSAQPYFFDERLKVFFSDKPDSVLTINDYAAVSFTNTMVRSFTYKSPITLNSLDFVSGVSDSAYLFDPFRIQSTSHPLYRIRGNFYDSTAMRYQAAIFDVQTLSDSTLRTIRVNKPDMAGFHFDLQGYQLRPGFDLVIRLDIRLRKLFDGINWLHDDQPLVKEKLRRNIPGMFQP